MKKIMVTIAAVAIAACAQAASVSWNLTGSSELAGNKVYVVESLAEFTSEANIANYLLGTAGNTAIFEAGRSGASASGTVRGIDDEKTGAMQSFYYVVVNSEGTGYWASSATQAEVYTTSNEHQDSEVEATAFVIGSATAWKTEDEPVVPGPGGNVPEPTSGLLMLIGAAGLALRRKNS
jgi:hypothetical protein